MHKIRYFSERSSVGFPVAGTVGAILFALTLITKRWALSHGAEVEKLYSVRIFPVLSQAISRVTGLLPFSAAEWILYLGIPVLIAYVCTQVYRMLTRPGWKKRLIHLISLLTALGFIGYSLFYVLWGWNYYRLPLEASLDLPEAEMSSEVLEEICGSLIEEARSVRDALPEDEKGCVAPSRPIREYFSEVNVNYCSLSKEYPDLWGSHYGPPKPVLASVGMSYADISGIFIPFTEEPNVNNDMPFFLKLSTASHEAAHQRGVAREEDANFMAFLSCRVSNDPSFFYSGTMLAVIYCMNELYDADYDAFCRCCELYSDAQKRDLAEHNAYWKAFEGPVQEASNNVNDQYLKSNHQELGILSYDRVTTLVIKWWYSHNKELS